jgi:hypothetical protein
MVRAMRLTVSGLLLALAAAAAGCGASAAKCDKACRNYFTLQYWAAADKQIEAAPPGERDKLREEKMEALEGRMGKGLQMCQSQCVEAADDDQASCMINAKTVAAVEACVNGKK